LLIHDFSTTSRYPTRNVKWCQSDQAELDCQPNFSFLRLSSRLTTGHEPMSHLPLLSTGKQLHDLWTSYGSSPRHWSAIHAFTTVRPCSRHQSSRGASWKAGSDRQKGYRRHPRPAAFSPDPLSPAFPPYITIITYLARTLFVLNSLHTTLIRTVLSLTPSSASYQAQPGSK
jgi:hypothetical protein